MQAQRKQNRENRERGEDETNIDPKMIAVIAGSSITASIALLVLYKMNEKFKSKVDEILINKMRRR